MLHVLALMALALIACRGEDSTQTSASTLTTANTAARDMPAAWNERLMAVASAEDEFLTLKGVRTAAMMHIAMHDALNATHRGTRRTRTTEIRPMPIPPSPWRRRRYEVAVDQYPAQRAQLTMDLQRWIDPVTDGAAKSTGDRSGQGFRGGHSPQAPRRWLGPASRVSAGHPMGPGVYVEFAEHSGTPQGFVFGAGWATVTPFVLRSPAQFRSPPPPAIDSDEYTLAFDGSEGNRSL